MPSFGEKLEAPTVSVHQWLYWHTDSTATDFHRTDAAPTLPVGEYTGRSIGVHWGTDAHWNTISRCSVRHWHTYIPAHRLCQTVCFYSYLLKKKAKLVHRFTFHDNKMSLVSTGSSIIMPIIKIYFAFIDVSGFII